MRISDIIGFKRANGPGFREVISVTPEMQLADAIGVLADRKIGLVVVCDAAGELVGVLSERDIIRVIAERGDGGLQHTVETAMTASVLTCGSQQHAHDAISIMAEKGIRHIPVVDDGKLQAVISITDLLRYLSKNAKPEEQAMLWAKIAWA